MRLETIILAALLAGARPVAAASPEVDYARDVKPILTARCASCHGAIRQKGGLRLDAAELARKGGEGGPSIEPGKSDESLLIERVTSASAEERMPPESEGVKLDDGEVAVLRSWINQGAKAPAEAIPEDPRRHWAYQEPARPPLPNVEGRGTLPNPIDAFLAAAHKARGVQSAPPVDNDLWLRRVTLDLTGLPPSRAELHAFRADTSPDAREKVVDRLLASPRYGERWARHWMDVWRYSDWYGLGEEVRFSHLHIWHWRDWIVEALNADKGYDRMVVEMLAGDEVAPEDPETLRATGFLARNWDIFNRNAWLANTVEHTARAFLGVTIQCARCHDHKFDPVSQVEYYRLRSFFEPYHVRIDRIPGQPDPAKGGLPRAFDDFVETPTYRFIRGDEERPDKSKPMTPATPAVLGGGEIRIESISLPVSASCPDKRGFVIEETRQAQDQAVAKAKAAVEDARRAEDGAAKALANSQEADRRALAAFQTANGQGDALKPTRDSAAKALEALAKDRQTARLASEARVQAESALAVAEARRDATRAVLDVERLEDAGTKKDAPEAWSEAARRASSAQARLAVLEATHERIAARAAEERAQRTLDGLAAGPSKDANAAAALAKAATELADARRALGQVDDRIAKAEATAKAPPTTAYTPRPLNFPRAKTTYRGEVVNTPYRTASTGRRLALARWITDRKNPLAARVAVNHIWARHFGEPLAASTYDFGLRTARPPLAELLDWLAVELMESGWSMKRIHRLIVTSEAYRMRSSGVSTDSSNASIDPDNRLLWRMNVKRMEAEVIRDSLLELAGKLDGRIGGADEPIASAEAGMRRSMYYRYARNERIPLLSTFDAPSIEECYLRQESIVPQQALALTNSGMVLTRAGELAERIGREVGNPDLATSREAFIVSAFEHVLGRAPSDPERVESVRALEQLSGVLAAENRPGTDLNARARSAFVHVLLNHNDFVTIR